MILRTQTVLSQKNKRDCIISNICSLFFMNSALSNIINIKTSRKCGEVNKIDCILKCNSIVICSFQAILICADPASALL